MSQAGELPVFLYRIRDRAGALLYVGITGNVSLRIGKHATTKSWWGQVADVEVEMFSGRAAAMIAEEAAIKAESPRYYIMHSDINEPAEPKRVSGDPMRTYTATATREGGWWVVEVDGVGATQGRTTAEAERMAVDLVAAMEDVPKNEIDIDVTFVAPGALAAEVLDAKEASQVAAEAQRNAAERIRGVVRRLLDAGMSRQDAARILKVAPQRITQLLAK